MNTWISAAVIATACAAACPQKALATPSHRIQASADSRCRFYTPRRVALRKLAIGETAEVVTFSTSCTGAFDASAAAGYLALHRWEDGKWRLVKEGISTIVPTLFSGTYRLTVRNHHGIPVEARVRFEYGAG